LRIFENVPVWAVLTTAVADGSDRKYPAGEKHAILVMVRAMEAGVAIAVDATLRARGWSKLVMERFKLLNEPFHSDEPVMAACYESAMGEERGGIVVYAEPIR
jgi:hypothetical protein